MTDSADNITAGLSFIKPIQTGDIVDNAQQLKSSSTKLFESQPIVQTALIESSVQEKPAGNEVARAASTVK